MQVAVVIVPGFQGLVLYIGAVERGFEHEFTDHGDLIL